MRRAPLLIASALLAGCSDTLDLGSARHVPLPQFRMPGAEPTPGPEGFGDGRDGALTASAGGVNDCAPISVVAGGSIVTDGTLFATGDKVLLWQTQYDRPNASGDTSPVEIEETGLAGRWQLATVTTAGSSTIFVDEPPLEYRDGGGASAQACRVPQFTDVSIPEGATIDSGFWTPLQGGGVVAFFVSGMLTIADGGTISVSGEGYRGGTAHQGNNGGTETDLDTSEGEGGEKGEGLDRRSNTRYGRGNWWQGAGGGNAHGAGGGGGGNGGAGGYGGREWDDPGDTEPASDLTRGMPGSAVAAGYPDRLFFGGGGGAGQCHHGPGGGALGCGDGGDGGGLILVFANQMTLSAGGVILADGDDAAPSTNDAASGGGAGGTIVIVAQQAALEGAISARGGDGADANWDNMGAANASGPGGGGGGGRVHVEVLGSLTGTPAVDVSGGSNGINTVPPADGDAWGATPGSAGVLFVPD